MSLEFGEEDAQDLFNGNINEDHLPSDDEGQGNEFGQVDAEQDEAGVKIELKKRAKTTRQRLSIDILRGPRGIQTLEEYFKNIKFKGKGHEREDLDEIMRRMQHWAHRMYPAYSFNDTLTTIERLAKKKPLQVHMSRYRLGLLESQNIVGKDVLNEDGDDELNEPAVDEPFDEFDALLGEQIAQSRLAPRTPFATKQQSQSRNTSSIFTTPSFGPNAFISTPHSSRVSPVAHKLDDTSDYAQPLPPSQPTSPKRLSAEQMARIAENRRLAQERLRVKQNQAAD